jgi:hypothetical protein
MKRVFMIAALSAVLAATLSGYARSQSQEPQDAAGLPDTLWKRGLAIAPVPLDLTGKNKKSVGLGSYIVNARSTCVVCHTNPMFATGGDPYRGQTPQINAAHYLAGGVTFGPFTSRNLTPEPPGNLPAGLTFDQFVQVMRTGKDFDNAHPQISPLLQVMPWPTFANMTDDDLQNIYDYLSSIPHAEPAP